MLIHHLQKGMLFHRLHALSMQPWLVSGACAFTFRWNFPSASTAEDWSLDLQAYTIDGVDVYPSASLHSLLPFANILVVWYFSRPPPPPSPTKSAFQHTALSTSYFFDEGVAHGFAHTLTSPFPSKSCSNALAMSLSRTHRWGANMHA
jgi:hypothetical protein